MGDALGNIGVIASALIIWLTDYSWRFYSDPLISLIITCIILSSAIPLCRAASRILLQAVPVGMSIEKITADVKELDGVASCHHVHVWQLSDTKLVASLHIGVDFDFKDAGSQRYMELVKEVRACLHGYGIHSSTIQPEFCLNAAHHNGGGWRPEDAAMAANGTRVKCASKAGSIGSGSGSYQHAEDECLLECEDACGDNACCTPARSSGAVSPYP